MSSRNYKYGNKLRSLYFKKVKVLLKISHVILFLSLCQMTEANTSVPLDTRNNLEGNGSASNSFEHDIKIQLHPDVEVVGQGSQTISFGLPLPPGTLVNTNNVVVLDENDQEVPAFVRSLAAWNNMPPKSLLCETYQSSGNPGIRSVLIQFENQFSTNGVKNFRVVLNRSRQLNIDSEIETQTTLREVNEGSYADHNLGFQIYEPKVLTVIEPEYLSCTNLTTLSGEINQSPDLADTDQAQHDFFYTAIQEFFGRDVYEPDHMIDFAGNTAAYWLYDRPQTFLNAYLRSGNVDQLREGLRATEDYKYRIYTDEDCAHLPQNFSCTGFFSKKNNDIDSSWKDSKYSYNENLVTAYLLTGNSSYLDTIPLPTIAVTRTVRFSSENATERHRANALLTTVMQYELTNDPTLLPYIKDAINNLHQRQQTALEGTIVNGCFNYSPEGGNIASFSPWMSSLLANALLRTYQATGDDRIPEMLVDLAQCQVDRGVSHTDVFASEPGGFANMIFPFYIAQSYGEKKDLDFDPYSSIEHSLDVALPIALGAYFTTDLDQQMALLDTVRDLIKTHDFLIQYWTRDYPGRPVFRLAPPRKYSWQYKNVGVLSWVLNKLDNSEGVFTPAASAALAAQATTGVTNWWQERVDSSLLHPDSNLQISTLAGLGGFGFGRMQIDFSLKVNRSTNSDITVPLTTLPGDDLTLPDSEPAGSLIPIPIGASIEGSNDMSCSGSDCHYIAKLGNILYEVYQANLSNGALQGRLLAIWDLSKKLPDSGRGEHCTSADAAGFPIQPLLWNADEIQASLVIDSSGNGDLGHAIRFILPNDRIATDTSLGGSSGRLYVRPATHAGGPRGPRNTVAYGARLKLRADFPTDGYNAAARVVINTMKRYGIVLADGGRVALTAESDQYTQTKWSDLGIDSHVFHSTLGASEINVEDFAVIDTGQKIAETYECVRNENDQDTDADGVQDIDDNCTLIANSDQRDTNGDGFGNLCDGDLNNDGFVSFADLSLFRASFDSTDPDADFDGSGRVSFTDLNIFRDLFDQAPGPAGEL